MGPRLATIVVEPRLLVREALKLLMIKHSYRVVCDVASTAEIGGVTISESDLGTAGQRHRYADVRPSERLEQTLKPLRRAMKTLA
jgi:hypothetical protein